MIDRKDFIIIVLISFFLAVTLYPKITGSVGEYDPWLDYNDDGKVDMRDIGPVARAFGASGDLTKNVIVTNFPLDEEGNLKVKTIHRTAFSEHHEVLSPQNQVLIIRNDTAGFKLIRVRMTSSDGSVNVWISHPNIVYEQYSVAEIDYILDITWNYVEIRVRNPLSIEFSVTVEIFMTT